MVGGKGFIWYFNLFCRFDLYLIFKVLSFLWATLNISFTTGVLASPNYPSNYPNNLERTSKIEVEEGLLIVLQFTAFDIESHPCSYCECDHLTIKDGDGTTLLEKACGWPSEGFIYGGRWTSSLPTSIRSRSNMVEIHFKTDGQVTKSGWSITWSSLQ